MAFQTGSRVRPELGRADVSGFANAGMIQANALANFGAQIGQGIQKYQKNKEITGVTLASIEGTLAQRPDLIASGKEQGGKIGGLFNKLEEDGVLNKSEALMLRGFLDTSIESDLAKQAAVDAQLERENLIARTEASRRSNQPKSTTYEQVRGVAKVMQEQFPDVEVDENTGALFVKNTGSKLNAFDTSNDAANVPGSITSMPGFEEWRKSKMSASARGGFDSSQYKMLPNPQ